MTRVACRSIEIGSGSAGGGASPCEGSYVADVRLAAAVTRPARTAPLPTRRFRRGTGYAARDSRFRARLGLGTARPASVRRPSRNRRVAAEQPEIVRPTDDATATARRPAARGRRCRQRIHLTRGAGSGQPAHTRHMTRPPTPRPAQRAFVAQTRRAILATTAPDNRPRLVPVCFVLATGRRRGGPAAPLHAARREAEAGRGPARPRAGARPARAAAGDARSSTAGTRTGRGSAGSASTGPARSGARAPRGRGARRGRRGAPREVPAVREPGASTAARSSGSRSTASSPGATRRPRLAGVDLGEERRAASR